MSDFSARQFIEEMTAQIKATVGNSGVLLALSGGVDSSVCAALLSKAVPGQLTCIFVDHGFMRLNESDEIVKAFSDKELNLIRVDAADRFLSKLAGVSDPEQKRRIIGDEFGYVFDEEAQRLAAGNAAHGALSLPLKFFAQGTNRADMIESGKDAEHKGAVVKTHHNLNLPTTLSFEGILEPLSTLFKDQIRLLAKELDLPAYWADRPPFPGPGLAIRVVGEVTRAKLDTLRKADAIFREEVERDMDKFSVKPGQYFAVHTGVNSVGVNNGNRVFESVIAMRSISTGDFMTGKYTPIPHETLSRASRRITDEIKEVSRVVYDITDKPPATIEWE